MRKVIVKLVGGLGNQLFQYSAANFLGNGLKAKIYYDISFYSKSHPNTTPRKYELFNFSSIDFPKTTRPNGCITLKDYNFSPQNCFSTIESLKQNDRDIYLDGYFQNYLFSQIVPPKFIPPDPREGVAIHIRRGDYVSNLHANCFHGTLPLDYYKRGINSAPEANKIHIFSDDIEWCQQNVSFKDKELVFETPSDAHADLIKMSKFKSLIIANSSFSWWAARLAEFRDQKSFIVAPGHSLWYNSPSDITKYLYSDKWIKIER